MKENDRADRLAGKAALTSGLVLGSSEVLRSSKHYLRAKDITSSIAWRREAWKEETLEIFLERTREGQRQSNKHWNCFKANVGETSVKMGGVHVLLLLFFEGIDTILN